MADVTITVGTRRRQGIGHEGVLRRDGAVVFACGHLHRNRDNSTFTNGRSARDCMIQLAKSARLPAHYRQARGQITAPPRGPYLTTGLIARMKAAAQVQAEEFDGQVAAVADLIGDGPVSGYAGRVILASADEIAAMQAAQEG